MSLFEAGMLFCFGVGWPVSVWKSLRTKVVSGKSPLFMAVVWVGYVSGIFHKVFYSFDWVITLYIVNLLMISADLVLYYLYLPKSKST